MRREEPDRCGLLAAFAEAHRELIAYARSVCAQGVADADDVVQEAFLRVWSHPGRWRLGSGGWFAILRRVVHDCGVDATRRAHTRHVELTADIALCALPSADEAYASRELLHAIGLALNSLSRARRNLFLRADLDGETPRAIAAEIGAKPKTVSNDLAEARKHVRAHVRAWLGPEERPRPRQAGRQAGRQGDPPNRKQRGGAPDAS